MRPQKVKFCLCRNNLSIAGRTSPARFSVNFFKNLRAAVLAPLPAWVGKSSFSFGKQRRRGHQHRCSLLSHFIKILFCFAYLWPPKSAGRILGQNRILNSAVKQSKITIPKNRFRRFWEICILKSALKLKKNWIGGRPFWLSRLTLCFKGPQRGSKNHSKKEI